MLDDTFVLGWRLDGGRLVFDVVRQRERPVRVWRFDRHSLKALRDVLPDGVLDSGSFTRVAWAEDLCVYRAGELLFGAVTHECYAFLRLPEAEWRQWKATGT
jgi:hypothetical protein